MRRRSVLVAGAILLVHVTARAQVPAAQPSDDSTPTAHTYAFTDLPYYEPLRAEPRAARILILFPAWSKAFPNVQNGGNRFAWQIVLGKELPLVARSNESVNANVLRAGKWGVGLWLPLSFHMIEDFKDESNPIVDTDYRFGFMVKAAYGVTDKVRLNFRLVPWAHESTHIGDEYTIHALTMNPTFERVNVSYEYHEYGISLEGRPGGNADLVLRTGGISPWNNKGYYDTNLLGSTVGTLTPSQHVFEPSVGGEYRAGAISSGWLHALLKKRQPYLSIDTRDKLVYNYHQTPTSPEERQWSWSAQIGATVPNNTKGEVLKQYFLQFYSGVNPYGQLRSQKDYWSLGIGWVFGY
jgi:hypothetical protein